MTVLPVVDYEPHVVSAQIPVPPTTVGPPRRDNRHRRLRAVPTASNTPPTAPVEPTAPSAQFQSAGIFADATLRGILEVIDRRRIPAQLRPMLADGLIDSVTSYARAAPARQSGAALRRVRLQATGPGETAFEIAASYTRGSRLHALACRVEWIATPAGTAWQVVALHIG